MHCHVIVRAALTPGLGERRTEQFSEHSIAVVAAVGQCHAGRFVL
jgi:hypothetical protein